MPGVDPRADLVLSDPEGSEAKLYAACKTMYLSAIKKGYVEACLIASNDLDKISEILGIPKELLEGYRHYFFDIQGFDKLSLLEVVEDAKTEDEKSLKIWAMSQGLDFVSWRINPTGKSTTISPVEGLQELYTIAVYKSKEALFSSNASESSKEATKWTKLSMDLARLLKVWVMDNNAAKRDIEMALKTISPEFKSFDSLDSKSEEAAIDGFGKLGDIELKQSGLDDIGDIGDLNNLE